MKTKIYKFIRLYKNCTNCKKKIIEGYPRIGLCRICYDRIRIKTKKTKKYTKNYLTVRDKKKPREYQRKYYYRRKEILIKRLQKIINYIKKA